MSLAAMAHASFHQARPFEPHAFFFMKNFLHVVLVSAMRSVLTWVRDGIFVMRGCGNRAKAAFHSCFIWSLRIHPVSAEEGVSGISRGRSIKRAVLSEEID